MSNHSDKRFDLAERTALFGEDVIRFLGQVRTTAISAPLITQLVRAATSVGANYCEGDEAGTRKEFRYRINICTREARECKFWLRMIAVAAAKHRDRARELWKEAHELNLIFAAIHRRTKPDD